MGLHPDILRLAVALQHGHHHHRRARQGGAVVVNSVKACLKEAGEIIQVGLGGREVVGIGELLMLKRDAERRKLEASGQGMGLDGSGVELGEDNKMKGGDKKNEAESGLAESLQKGNVIYKGVGLGLMDVVVGGDLVALADERGWGLGLRTSESGRGITREDFQKMNDFQYMCGRRSLVYIC